MRIVEVNFSVVEGVNCGGDVDAIVVAVQLLMNLSLPAENKPIAGLV